MRLDRPEIFTTIPVVKFGYISQKQKDRIVVVGEEETFTFSLDDVETAFMPRKYDQISLTCRVQRDPKLVTEAGVTVEVSKIEPNIVKRIVGNITFVEPNEYGLIEEKFFFFWDALVADYRVVTKGDKVTAECIQCERVEQSVFEWRCLKVVLVESVNNNADDEHPLFSTKPKECENINGIEITDDVLIEFNDINITKQFTMVVKNTSADVRKVLSSVFVGDKYGSQLRLISPGRDDSFSLQPGEEKQYKFEAKSRDFGDKNEKFYVRFSGPTGVFKIFRNITVSVHDTDQLHPFIGTGANLSKNTSYTQQVFRRNNSHMIPGTPLRKSANFVKTRFLKWEVPRRLIDMVLDPKSSHNFISETLDSAMPDLKNNLCIKNYGSVFHYLLYLEECEMFHNMRRYDKKGFFKREGEYLSLPVQNIAESRPSLVIGEQNYECSHILQCTQLKFLFFFYLFHF